MGSGSGSDVSNFGTGIGNGRRWDRPNLCRRAQRFVKNKGIIGRTLLRGNWEGMEVYRVEAEEVFKL